MRRLAGALIGLLALLTLAPSSTVRAIEESSPRIVAVGDVHGSPQAFLRLLRAAELVNESGEWTGGDAILVQTGDLTDRGPGVREVLDLMRRLERSAADDGGRVVSLLGNHEVFNLIAYYDYQSTPLPVFTEIASAFETKDSEKERKRAYRAWARWATKYPNCPITRDQAGAPARRMTKDDWLARNPLGFVEYQEAMSQRGEYGRWLRARKVVVNLQDTLFLHGGLSPELLGMDLTSLDSINAAAAADLAQFDADSEWLENEGVTPPHATPSEAQCAVVSELQALGAPDPGQSADARRRKLEEVRSRLPGGGNWLLLDPFGPVWYRGYANWSEEEAETGLETVFGTFGGKRVVVGHTPQPGAVVARFENRVFLIDTAMAYPELKGRAVALEIRGDAISEISAKGRVGLTGLEAANVSAPSGEPAASITGYAPSSGSIEPVAGAEAGSEAGAGAEVDQVPPTGDGSASADTAEGLGETPPEPAEPAQPTEPGESPGLDRVWLAEDGSPLPFEDDEAVLDFLRTAEVIEKEPIGKGVTRAKRLRLEKNGIQARAAFHDVDIEEPRRREKNKLIINFRDSYLNNMAAYELGRLLGVTNLTPTTVRKIGRPTGSIQLWIEKTIDETDRRKRGDQKALSVWLRRRIADMWVFDNLINNFDRNQGNMLHDSRGEFWMIDHTRSFNGSNQLPTPDRMKRCSKDLLAAIRNLDEELTRERLRPFLRSFEINALFVRREKLLAYLDERIAAQGESSVLFSYEDSDDAVTVYYQEDDVPEAPE